MVEITPGPVDENCYINTAIDAGYEKRLNKKNISPLQEVLQWPNTPIRRVNRNTEYMQFLITHRA
jgi:hypothetical protein